MLIYYLKHYCMKRKWRKKNKHNYTMYKKIFGDMNRVHIGRYTYGEIYVSSPNTTNELFIGDFCSIAGDVRFILGADHPINHISTYPFKSLMIDSGIDAISKGNITIENDVWIGQGGIILSGVHVGQGSVIAAGAVVTKDVPPYAIVGGVPAKVIKYRFSQEIINKLLKVDYSKLTGEMVKEHIDDLYQELTDVKQLEWLPEK